MTAPGGPLASGHVDVHADLSSFDRELQAKLSASLAQASRNARREFNSIERAAESAGRGVADAFEDAATRAELAAARMAAVWCAAADQAERCFEKLGRSSRDIDQLTKSSDKARKSFTLLGAAGNLAGLAGSIAATTAKWLAYAFAAGAVSGAMGGLLLVLVKIGGALLPLGGLIFALPAAFFTAAAGAGALALALRGMGDVITALAEHDLDKFNEALAELSPNARKFAGAMRELLPHFDEMQDAVQDTFFAGLADTLRDVAGNLLPEISAGLVGIAGSLNAALKDTGASLAAGAARSNVAAIMESAGVAADYLAGAIRPVVDAMLAIGVTGGPVIERIAAAIGRVAEQFATWAVAAAESGELAEILNAAVDAAVLFGRILGNISGVVLSVFQAGEATGGGLLQILEQVTGAANDFFNSVEGQTALTSFFASIEAVSGPILTLLRTAAGIIGTDLAPLLSKLVAGAAPGLITFLEQLGVGLRNLMPAAGPLGEAIGKLFAAIAPLLPVIGELGAILLGGLATGLKSFATVLEPLVAGLAGPLGEALGKLGPVFADLAAQAGPLAAALALIVTDALEPLKDPAFAAAVGDFATRFVERLPELVDALWQLVEASARLAPQFATFLTDTLTSIGPQLPVIADALIDTALAVTGMALALTPLLPLLLQVATAALDELQPALALIKGPLDGLNVGFTLMGESIALGTALLRDAVATLLATDDAITAVYNGLRDLSGLDFLPKIDDAETKGGQALRDFAKGAEKELPKVASIADRLKGVVEKAGLGGGSDASMGRRLADAAAKLTPPVSTLPSRLTRPGAAGGHLGARDDTLVSEKAKRAAEALAEKLKREAERFAEALAKAGEFLADGFVTGLIGTVPQITSAIEKMGDLVTDLLGRARAKPMIDSWNDETRALIELAKRREGVADRLKTAQAGLDKVLGESASLSAAIAEKVRGAFELVPAEGTRSINALLRQMGKAATTAAAFTKNFAALRGRGLNEALLSQLAEAGPIAGAKMAARLARADAGQIAALNAMSAKLEGAATAAGGVVSNALFGAGVAAAKGLVAGLISQRKQIEDAMVAIARGMQKAIRAALGIRSPSTVMFALGQSIPEGLRLAILAGLGGIDAAMTRVTATITGGITAPTVGPLASVSPLRGVNPAAPAATYQRAGTTVSGSQGGRSGALFGDVHLHMPTADPEAAAQAVINRVAARVA